jgi:disulfide bond formation protein DsbB
MSLVYSEYFGFIPCSLCWLQRIAIYPQALLVIMAWKTKDTLNFPKYGIGLSAFGFIVATYQYIYQMIPAEVREGGALPCLVDGSGADCASKVIDLFGFVTFPFISAVTFAFLIMMYLYLLRRSI